MGEIRWIGRLGLTGALLASVPALAQNDIGPDTGLSQIEGLAEDYETSRLEEEADGVQFLPDRPWILQARLPVDWRSNLTLAERGLRNGATIAPDLSLFRSWSFGRFRLFTEVGAFTAMALRNSNLDSAGLYGTFELEAGTPAEGLTPYIAYEPFSAHTGAFATHLLTLHDFSAGVRRAWGPTFIDGYVRRNEASIDIAERWSVGTTVSHTIRLQGSALLNLRGEAEFRRYDVRDGIDRRDFRTRLRTRLIVPIDHAVDLQVTADLRRNRSSLDGFTNLNVIIGPTLVARFGF